MPITQQCSMFVDSFLAILHAMASDGFRELIDELNEDNTGNQLQLD